MGRFISGDEFVSDIGGDVRGYNLFAYCFNNPVNASDSSGNWPRWIAAAVATVVAVVVSASAVVNHIVNAVNKNKIDNEIQETYDKDTAKQEIDTMLEQYGDNVSANFTETGIEITNSIEVDSRYDRQKISTIISRTEDLTDRSSGNLSSEWFFHNLAYALHIKRESACDAFLDYSKDKRPFVVGATGLLEFYGWE